MHPSSLSLTSSLLCHQLGNVVTTVPSRFIYGIWKFEEMNTPIGKLVAKILSDYSEKYNTFAFDPAHFEALANFVLWERFFNEHSSLKPWFGRCRRDREKKREKEKEKEEEIHIEVV
jgi:hypothetical protein